MTWFPILSIALLFAIADETKEGPLLLHVSFLSASALVTALQLAA